MLKACEIRTDSYKCTESHNFFIERLILQQVYCPSLAIMTMWLSGPDWSTRVADIAFTCGIIPENGLTAI